LLLRGVLRALVSVEGLRRGGGESSAVVCGWRVEEAIGSVRREGLLREAALRVQTRRRSFDVGHYLFYVSLYHFLAGVSRHLCVSV